MSGVCMHALHVWGCNDGADRVVPLLFLPAMRAMLHTVLAQEILMP